MSNEPGPHACSKKGRYSACESLRDASSVGVAHFLSIHGRMLCLLGVWLLQNVPGRT